MKEPARIKVLIAEDEEMLGTVLEQFLTSRGHVVTVVRDGRAALDALRRDAFDVALLDIVMPELDGLEVLRQVVDEPAPPQVIIITGNGTIETAITAIRLGAYDYLSKPYRMAEIDVLVRRAWEKRQLARQNALLQSRLERADGMAELVTRYAPMQAVLALVERVAKSDSPVLISGEAGTGKELIARLLHRLSGRGDAGGGMVDVDCASIGDGQMESELFGHEKGSVPGVLKRKTGGLRAGERRHAVPRRNRRARHRVAGQAAAGAGDGELRAAGRHPEARRGCPGGRGDQERSGGGGRHQGVPERSVLPHQHHQHLVAAAARPDRPTSRCWPAISSGMFGGPVPPALTADAIAALESYPWPGNVRELRNVIERAVLLASSGVITRNDLPLASHSSHTNGSEPESPAVDAGRSRAPAHRGGSGAVQLAPGACRDTTRHLLEDPVPEDP